MTACAIAHLVRTGRISAPAVTEAALRSISELDPGIRAFTEVWADAARPHAARVRGHLEVLIRELELAVAEMPRDSLPRYCALAGIGEARGRLRAVGW